MLARRRTFNHPIGGTFDLPLLVPSFSSKGFGLDKAKDKTHDYCPVSYELEEFGRLETRSVLISAYDIHFRHFEAPNLQQQCPLAHLAKTSLVLLDSGGYELTDDFDSAELRRSPYKHKNGFAGDEYKSVLEAITSKAPTVPLVIANFDRATRDKPLAAQIKAARQLFDGFPKCASTFIIKPGSPTKRVVNPDSLSKADYKNLKGFNVVGVTEKELGKNLKDRLMSISLLRRHLDSAGIDAPIHLWGGLDPVLTPLFFFAGAEIFDGISWLRYAFRQGVALNRECGAILDESLGVSTSTDLARRMASILNLRMMVKMESNLQAWVDFDGENFDMFDQHVRPHLFAAYQQMTIWDSSLKKGGG